MKNNQTPFDTNSSAASLEAYHGALCSLDTCSKRATVVSIRFGLSFCLEHRDSLAFDLLRAFGDTWNSASGEMTMAHSIQAATVAVHWALVWDDFDVPSHCQELFGWYPDSENVKFIETLAVHARKMVDNSRVMVVCDRCAMSASGGVPAVPNSQPMLMQPKHSGSAQLRDGE